MRTSRLLAAAAVALTVTACGSSHGPSSSASSSAGASSGPSFSSAVAQAYNFSRCMRAHGMTDFPDPKVVDHDGERGIAIQAVGSKDNPTFVAAYQACQKYAPPPGPGGSDDTPAHKQLILAFSHCMRRRGIAGFPDPTSQGQLSLSMVQSAGIDIHSQQFLTAALSCASVTHGLLTPAKVRQAINGDGQ